MQSADRQPRPPTLLIACLALLAGLAVSGGAVAAAMVLGWQRRGGQVTPGTVAIAVLCVFGGAAIGCALWAVAWIVRRQSRAALLQQNTLRALQYVSPELPPAPEDQPRDHPDAAATVPLELVEPVSQPELLQQILSQLVELNDNLLLSPEQREAKRTRRQQRYSGELVEQIGLAVEKGDFARADQRLAELADRVPDDAHCEALRQKIAEARRNARADDIRQHTRQVDDLMAVGAFSQAEQLAQQLHERYPGEDEPAELLGRVRREAEKFHTERRNRLRSEVERHAEARQWRAALEAAERFIEEFPDSVDAQAVHATLPTICDNARLEEVRELRDAIRDLIERRRYADALEVAADLIERFPDTVAANELRHQLDRLKELARRAPGNGPAGS
jgi:tetratricopeptide (TPR) repeat protein